MDLSIIIVNWNGGELLIRCLQSIRDSRTSFSVKVIVVDNNSSDGSREQAQREFTKFQIFNSGENLGFGRANNLARPLVQTPLVLFLNPDTELRPDTLERMFQLMHSRPEVGAAGCMMRYQDGTVQEQGLQWTPSPWTVLVELLLVNRMSRRAFKRWLPTLDPLRSGYVRKLYGGFLMARKEVLDRAGWFDERYFMYAEDVDLCRTVLDQGCKLYYLSTAEIIHVAGGTTKKAPSGFSVLMKCESIAKLMRKHYGSVGSLAYRLEIASGSLASLLALTILRGVCTVLPVRTQIRFTDSLFKHRLALLWSLGLRKPFVAQHPPEHGIPTELQATGSTIYEAPSN